MPKQPIGWETIGKKRVFFADAHHEVLEGWYDIFVELYQIALPATHLRRCGGLVTAVQAFDLTHVFDVIIPAQSQAT